MRQTTLSKALVLVEAIFLLLPIVVDRKTANRSVSLWLNENKLKLCCLWSNRSFIVFFSCSSLELLLCCGLSQNQCQVRSAVCDVWRCCTQGRQQCGISSVTTSVHSGRRSISTSSINHFPVWHSIERREAALMQQGNRILVQLDLLQVLEKPVQISHFEWGCVSICECFNKISTCVNNVKKLFSTGNRSHMFTESAQVRFKWPLLSVFSGWHSVPSVMCLSCSEKENSAVFHCCLITTYFECFFFAKSLSWVSNQPLSQWINQDINHSSNQPTHFTPTSSHTTMLYTDRYQQTICTDPGWGLGTVTFTQEGLRFKKVLPSKMSDTFHLFRTDSVQAHHYNRNLVFWLLSRW